MENKKTDYNTENFKYAKKLMKEKIIRMWENEGNGL